MSIDPKRRLLTRFEASKLTGIPQRSLKYMVSKDYPYTKPPHKPIGKTTFYGPQDQLIAWFKSDLKAKPENNKRLSDKSDNKLKVIK